jgi:peptidoglycan hydrolase-like protein with peptidoglycan-binding domain
MTARFIFRRLAVGMTCLGTAVALAVPANAATSTMASTNAAGVYNVANCHFAGQLLTIRIGASGSLVRFLQCLLIANNLALPGGADGSFGPNTQSAVIRFQQNNHLQVDGVVGPQTWNALFFIG